MTVKLDDLGAVYRDGYERFLRVASVIAGSEALGADAVHDGFLRAIRSRGSFRGEAPLEAWVWRIVVNAARDRRRSVVTEEEWTPDSSEQLPSVNGSSDDPFALRSWLASLPERQRTVVFLRYFADLDYRGIASVLGIEVGTVSATLNAAHARLRDVKQEEAER